MKVAKVILSLALASLAATFNARAFVGNLNEHGHQQRWNLTDPGEPVHTNVVNRATRAIRYFIASETFSKSNREAELNAVRACFDQWQAIPGTRLRFEEGGLVSGAVDINTSDNTNLIFWARTSPMVNNGRDNITGATGVTFWDSLSNGAIAEADIVLNGVHFTWFTDFNNTANQAQFVEAVLLHEVGHFLGLAHSPVGAATMFPRAGNGVNPQAGLSPDEISAARALYPSGAILATLGTLSGQVNLRGEGVFGAIVVAEDLAGNLVGGTITRSNGRFEMPALPPGQYHVRVSPVDSPGSSYYLLRGRDISSAFSGAEPSFLPTMNTPVSVIAGAQVAVNFTVGETPAFRIGKIRPPTHDPSTFVVVNYPVTVRPGQSNITVGVYGSDLPTSNAILRVTGEGLSFGPTTFKPDAFPGLNPKLNGVSVLISVAENATPGMRSFVLQQNNHLAHANGFLEVLPKVYDYNFDGLDDLFQRKYFPRWTCPDAAPDADPDGDGYSNAAEHMAGTDPTDPASVMRVSSVRLDASGATITWPSAPGKRYQVLSRPHLTSLRGWQPVSDPITATGNSAQFLDSSELGAVRFYRVQAVP
jgi:hypothetical protein